LKEQSIDVQVHNVSIEAALSACFKNLPINYKIIDKTVVINRSRTQQHKAIVSDLTESLEVKAIDIRGRVIGQDGASLSGVSVRLKGTSTGTVTNTNGQYTISIPN